MSLTVDNNQDILDSWDIIARLKELESNREEIIEAAKEKRARLDALTLLAVERDFTSAEADEEIALQSSLWLTEDGAEFTYTWSEDDETEYQILKAVNDDGEGIPDWKHGATLIRDSYFEDYAREFAEDIGALKDSDHWPCNYIDWEKAVRELRMDYSAVEWDDVTYWVRN